MSCTKNRKNLENGEYLLGYNKTNKEHTCGYLFNNSGVLIRNLCQTNSIPAGYSIEYYETGVPKSIEYYVDGLLEGDKILFYESGVIKSITPYSNGKINGEIILYFPNGHLNAINLFEHDSLYYIRVYNDTLNISKFGEHLTPIVTINKDSVQVNDSVIVTIRLPRNDRYELLSGKYFLFYETLPAEYVLKLTPVPENKKSLSSEDFLISIRGLKPSHEKFYCYITTKDGTQVSDIIYRDIYFIE